MTNTKHIAIIGGGAVGPLLLTYLSEEAKQSKADLLGTTIHLIDPKGFGNGGIAYGQSRKEHLLNSLVSEMAPFRKDAFFQFLYKNNLNPSDSDFYSRRLYQEFIKEELVDQPIQLFRNLGANIREHKANAFVQQNDQGLFDLTDINGKSIDINLQNLSNDDIIITSGYGPNQNFTSLREEEGFVHNIYGKSSILEKEPKLQDENCSIAVIGSGPGLYDVVNELKPPYKNFLVFSGTGHQLPVRDISIEGNEISIPPESLLNLDKKSSLLDATKALSYEFNEAAQGRSQRRISLDIQKSIKQILLNLDPNVAVAFRKSAEYIPVKHLATPIPASSKEQLGRFNPTFVKACLDEDQIEKLDNGKFKISTNNDEYIVDAIINATGHGRHNSAIIQTLKKQGLVRVNPVTNTLETDETGYRIPQSGLAIIGPATHLGTDGMESFAKYAQHCAKRMISQFRLDHLHLADTTFEP